MKKQNKAFTLVELIVVITILAILGTIAFISLQGYSAQARDSRRLSDINNIKKSLELFSLNTGVYPLPDNSNKFLYDTELVWTQGVIGNNVLKNLSKNLNELPVDPLTELEYTYSTINSKNKYELLAIFESDLIGYKNNLINKTYAKHNNYPKISGNYNGVFVKTSSYYIITPSIINSQINNGNVSLNSLNIKSQITSGGKNVFGNGIISSSTGNLNITLSVYTGSINGKSSDKDKQNLAKIIQEAYTGSSLSNDNMYKNILDKTSEKELVALVNDLVLNNNFLNISSETDSFSCDGTANGMTKSFYDIAQVEFGQNCDTHKKIFTCDEGIWKDGENLANTSTYGYSNCIVKEKVIDIEAPIGGDIEIPTESDSINFLLTITCPTDLGASIPIEMYISGNISDTSVWEECVSNKTVTLSTGNGTKTIYIKFRDSAGNQTSEITKTTNLNVITYTYSWYTSSYGTCSVSSSWGDRGSCSESCGGGTMTRYCVKPSGTWTRTVYCERNDGAQVSDSYCTLTQPKPISSTTCTASLDGCSGLSTQSTSCNTQSCPTSGAYTYGDWGTCSETCGGGTQERIESCDYDSCYSPQATSQSCNTQACPTSGPYTYGSWGSCSVSCGGGTMYRTQYCNYDSCYSPQATSASCNTQSCPTSGAYTYGSRGSCSVSCGGGTMYRTQYCNYDSCYNPQATSTSCNTQTCCSASMGNSCVKNCKITVSSIYCVDGRVEIGSISTSYGGCGSNSGGLTACPSPNASRSIITYAPQNGTIQCDGSCQ